MNSTPTQKIFITGLPRSRTSWLANFFTWGDAFMFHDALRHCTAVSDLWHLFQPAADSILSVQRRAGRPGLIWVGDSDSGLTFVWRELDRLAPEAKWIYVVRNQADAVDSAVKYFTEHPYLNVPVPNAEHLYATFTAMLAAGVALQDTMIRQGRLRMIHFEQLQSAESLKSVWDWAFEGRQEFPLNRFHALSGIVMNPASETIALNPERFNTLLRANNP